MIRNPYDITEIKIEQENTPVKKNTDMVTPYPADPKVNETESEHED